MAQNYICSGERLLYTNGTGSKITSGSVIIIGILAAIVLGDVEDGASVEVATEGVFEVPKTTPLAISQGDELFWNTGTKKVTKTKTDTPLGTAYEDAASGAATVLVMLNEINHAPQAVFVAQNTTANGSDAATTQALANSLKTTVNAITTALINAGIMAAS